MASRSVWLISVRYYGWYSNVSRGKLQKVSEKDKDHSSIEEFCGVSASAAKRARARFIMQVYEGDPLVCPRCAGAVRIVAVIEQPGVIEKILTHLTHWPTSAHSPPAHSVAAYAPHLGPDAAGRRGTARWAPTCSPFPWRLTAGPGASDTPRHPGGMA